MFMFFGYKSWCIFIKDNLKNNESFKKENENYLYVYKLKIIDLGGVVFFLIFFIIKNIFLMKKI